MADCRRPPPQCRNGAGEVVDWWFIYKGSRVQGGPDSTGYRYVYYDSKMASEVALGAKHAFAPMSDARLLNNRASSPLLRTIYDPWAGIHVADNTLIIAVNDQPSAQQDAFKLPVADNGHVKFLMSAQVEHNPGEAVGIVRSYFIQHSLPNFPHLPVASVPEASPVFFREYPQANAIFDTNAPVNGQHFMCMSFEDRQAVDDVRVRGTRQTYQLAYRPAELQAYLASRSHHLACILNYLRTTHAAVIATNYQAYDPVFAIYHRYLNVFQHWTPAIRTEANSNMGRKDYPRLDGNNYESMHLCPMWPLGRQVNFDGRNWVKAGKKTDCRRLYTQRHGETPICRSWSRERPHDITCLSSAHLRTTRRQYQLEGLLISKSKAVALAPFDELIAPLVVPLADYAAAEAEVLDGEPHSMDIGLIVQSWTDGHTMPDDTLELFPPGSPLKVDLNVVNSKGVYLPVEGAAPHHMPTRKDHAKWALAVPKARTGTAAALFCISDLNRTFKHVDDPGRGGSLTCFSQGPLTELMLGLQPQTRSNRRNAAHAELGPLYASFKQNLLTSVKYTDDMAHVYVSALRADDQVCLFRMPNPFKTTVPVTTVSIPTLTRANPEGALLLTDELFISGDHDTFFGPPVRDVETLITVERPVFKTGSSRAAIVLHEVENRLQISLPLWSRMQQAFHQAARASTDFTRQWLTHRTNVIVRIETV